MLAIENVGLGYGFVAALGENCLYTVLNIFYGNITVLGSGLELRSFSDGRVAVNGSISDALSLASGLFDFSCNNDANVFLSQSATGIIVETPFELKSGILLGSVAQIIEQTV